MDLNTLLLIAITWLLWTIHQDLVESNDRQRNLKSAMTKWAEHIEKALEQAASKKTTSRTTTKKATTAKENG